MLTNLLEDPRDAPFVRTMIVDSLMVIPFAAVLMLTTPPWWLCVAYFAVMFSGFDRFTLMLHCTSHRRLFKREFGWLNGYVPRVLAPFYGQSPETYFVHHVGMHHPENNLADDLSSTMKYRRDSFFHFLRYLARFIFGGLPDMTSYMVRKRRFALLTRMLIGELGTIAIIAALLAYNPRATMVILILPILMARCLMMAGNWAQHAFIDPADPANPYKNSITCINHRYNERCFNDGYHIAHHVAPTLHWTELPGELADNEAVYRNEDAIVFERIDFLGIWLMLMLKRYRRLAGHVAGVHRGEKSEVELVAWLKSRTRPIVSPSGLGLSSQGT